MNRVYIAIGSNLDNPILKARLAIEHIKTLPNSRWVGASSLYCSKPMGPQDQPDYINAVVAIDTQLAPLALLDHTQAIELKYGRVRKNTRWGPRTLDLDILLYGDLQLDTEKLTIPHYGMKTREFVLYPLAEITQDLSLPDGSRLSELLKKMDKNELTTIQ